MGYGTGPQRHRISSRRECWSVSSRPRAPPTTFCRGTVHVAEGSLQTYRSVGARSACVASGLLFPRLLELLAETETAALEYRFLEGGTYTLHSRDQHVFLEGDEICGRKFTESSVGSFVVEVRVGLHRHCRCRVGVLLQRFAAGGVLDRVRGESWMFCRREEIFRFIFACFLTTRAKTWDAVLITRGEKIRGRRPVRICTVDDGPSVSWKESGVESGWSEYDVISNCLIGENEGEPKMTSWN